MRMGIPHPFPTCRASETAIRQPQQPSKQHGISSASAAKELTFGNLKNWSESFKTRMQETNFLFLPFPCWLTSSFRWAVMSRWPRVVSA